MQLLCHREVPECQVPATPQDNSNHRVDSMSWPGRPAPPPSLPPKPPLPPASSLTSIPLPAMPCLLPPKVHLSLCVFIQANLPPHSLNPFLMWQILENLSSNVTSLTQPLHPLFLAVFTVFPTLTPCEPHASFYLFTQGHHFHHTLEQPSSRNQLS